MQRRLEEVCEELRAAQGRNSSLQATLDNAQQDSSTLSGQKMREGCLNGHVHLDSGEKRVAVAVSQNIK